MNNREDWWEYTKRIIRSYPALRRKAEFPGVALLVPVCAMVLALILFYREHAADPILRHYYVETLALAALTVLLLEFAAFAFRGGAPRRSRQEKHGSSCGR